VLEQENGLPYHRITLLLASEWRFRESMDFAKLASLISKGLRIHEIKGYHHRLFVEPQIEILGNQLRKYLDHVKLENEQDLENPKI
jgi:hypothetical protein